MKQNCWDYKKCGRESGGPGCSSPGVCPAALDAACDGINAGKNAGRICWSISGTLCTGRPDGTFAEKQLTCLKCGFYQKVRMEEGGDFRILPPDHESVDSAELHKRLFDVQQLLKIGHQLLTNVDLDELLTTIVEEACSIVDAVRGTVYIVDEATSSLRSKVILAEELSEVVVPIDDTSIAGYVANNGVSVNIQDAYADLAHISPKMQFNRSFDDRSGFRTRSVLAVPILAQGQLIGVLQILNKRNGVFDSEDEWFLSQFAIEAGLALHNAKLYDDVRTLKELDKLKSEFVDLLAHELKSPLATIESSLELLLRQDIELSQEKRADFLMRVRDRTAQLGHLISYLLELSRIKRGRALGDVKPVSVKQLLSTQLAEHESELHRKEMRVSLSMPDSDPHVRADERSIKLIFSNLISNAIKYSPPDSTVKVTVEDRERDTVVSVADQGIGIPEGEQADLFSEFFRASNAKKSGVEGTGLGLAGTKHLIERFGGDIWVKSKEGDGATFFVRFPKATPAD